MKLNIAILLAAATARAVQFWAMDSLSDDVHFRFGRRGGRTRNDPFIRKLVQKVNKRQRLMAQFERMKQIVAAYERSGI